MFNSPSNNYGSVIGTRPYSGGTIGRSLTSTSRPTTTGNQTRDAMMRAQSDLSRNQMMAGREQFENSFRRQSETARANDVMGMRSDAGRRYELDTRREVDDLGRDLRLNQSKARIAQQLGSNKAVDRWRAIGDYVGLATHPAFLHPQSGFISHALYTPIEPMG